MHFLGSFSSCIWKTTESYIIYWRNSATRNCRISDRIFPNGKERKRNLSCWQGRFIEPQHTWMHLSPNCWRWMASLLIVGAAGAHARLAPKWAGSIPKAHASGAGEQVHKPATAVWAIARYSGTECAQEKTVGRVRRSWWVAGTTFVPFMQSSKWGTEACLPLTSALQTSSQTLVEEHRKPDKSSFQNLLV